MADSKGEDARRARRADAKRNHHAAAQRSDKRAEARRAEAKRAEAKLAEEAKLAAASAGGKGKAAGGKGAKGASRAKPAAPPAGSKPATAARGKPAKDAAAAATGKGRGRKRGDRAAAPADGTDPDAPMIEVRRIHRRDLNRVWEFLKISFHQVNLETVEYQRPRTKRRFVKTYDEEGIDQLVFEVEDQIVAYAECAHEVVGNDNWINEDYFERRKMRPLFVEELAVHPDWNGRGVGSFVLEQLHHLAKVRGLSHLVLEVAENNEHALQWYRKRNFRKLDAAIFLATSVDTEPELLPPKPVKLPPPPPPGAEAVVAAAPTPEE